MITTPARIVDHISFTQFWPAAKGKTVALMVC